MQQTIAMEWQTLATRKDYVSFTHSSIDAVQLVVHPPTARVSQMKIQQFVKGMV